MGPLSGPFERAFGSHPRGRGFAFLRLHHHNIQGSRKPGSPGYVYQRKHKRNTQKTVKAPPRFPSAAGRRFARFSGRSRRVGAADLISQGQRPLGFVVDQSDGDTVVVRRIQRTPVEGAGGHGVAGGRIVAAGAVRGVRQGDALDLPAADRGDLQHGPRGFGVQGERTAVVVVVVLRLAEAGKILAAVDAGERDVLDGVYVVEDLDIDLISGVADFVFDDEAAGLLRPDPDLIGIVPLLFLF